MLGEGKCMESIENKQSVGVCDLGKNEAITYSHKKGGWIKYCPLLAGLLLGVVSASTVFALEIPNAGSLLRDQQQMNENLPARIPVTTPPKAIQQKRASESELKISIKMVRFTGVDGLVSEKELQEVLKDAIGKELGVSGLLILADQVTQYLKSEGFILARAFLPKQEISDGIVEISILPGRIEGKADDIIDIQGENLRISEKKLKAIATAALTAGAVIKITDLERALLLMNDLPGISAHSILKPGITTGHSRITVEVEEGALFTGSTWLDNYGSRYNGTARANGLFQLNDPFGMADQLNVLATVAEDLTMGLLNYVIPIGSHGLNLSTGVTGLQYHTGKEFSALKLEGTALTFSAKMDYPLVRSRKFNMNVGVGYDWKALKDEALSIDVSDKRVNNFSLVFAGHSFDTLLGGGLTNWSLRGIVGDLDLSRVPEHLSIDKKTAKTDGSFNKFSYNLGRLQKLPANFSLYGGFLGQFASQNLDSSEEFSLGGPYGVRAYPLSEASGDEGWIANVELRYDVPQNFYLGNVQLQVFYDIGETKLHHTLYQGAITNTSRPNRYQLSAVGTKAVLTKSDIYSVQAVWAIAIGDNPGQSLAGNNADGKDQNNRFWLQATIWF
jgi:hemolysin activation/secretion protein